MGWLDYFELVLVSHVAGAGSLQSMALKGFKIGWLQMFGNQGANWQSNGQSLSIKVTVTDDQTLVFADLVPTVRSGLLQPLAVHSKPPAMLPTLPELFVIIEPRFDLEL
ncbi:hypothetical protein ZIOFF_075634 [Zingiber officinale]|uniref:Expansin-like CBD domain-containing protein n=1 Tax=Zingiber officinale TaxID=94328 RepID=A0A8J5C4N8_ZINOF|nr:hypothetical protein ZIOFF_075634 [Zingiber officinale]